MIQELVETAMDDLRRAKEDALYAALVAAGVEAPIHPPSLAGRLFSCRQPAYGPDAVETYMLDDMVIATFTAIEIDRTDPQHPKMTRKAWIAS